MNATLDPGRTPRRLFPELDVRLDQRQVHVDPQDIQLDSVVAQPPIVAVEFPTTSPEALRVTGAADKSRVQWWPMIAAALVGIGVSLLAFGAVARFGQFYEQPARARSHGPQRHSLEGLKAIMPCAAEAASMGVSTVPSSTDISVQSLDFRRGGCDNRTALRPQSRAGLGFTVLWTSQITRKTNGVERRVRFPR